MTSFRRISISLVIAASLLSLTALSAGAHRRNADPASCTVASVPLGSILTVTGSGQPGTNYDLAIVWPNNNGTGGTVVTANSSGTWSTSIWAYFSGSYAFQLSTTRGSLLATCSTTVS